ncbi:MAG: Gfo/Idh/MocA family oxidoreductase [Lachnospiraceae bacterium]|nr:Gfo/Idh/MocA family oxidoreductase [Lachnospiraceae bacterium]
MRLGILGAGKIVKEFLTFADRVPDLTIVSICSRPQSDAKLKQLCAACSIPHYDTDPNQMLEREEIDTVYVALPNNLHYSACREALLAGKNVICEKPLTSSYTEARDLAELAEKQGRILLEAISTSYLPIMKEIKRKLPDLGRIRLVSANFSQYSSRWKDFRQGIIHPVFNPEMAGGALMDINIYNIHFLVDLFGAPDDVHYYPNIDRGVETSGILILNYPDFTATSISAKDSESSCGITIQADLGHLEIHQPANAIDSFTIQKNGQPESLEEVSAPFRNHRMYDEFVRFSEIIRDNDLAFSHKAMEKSLAVTQTATFARETAGILVPSEI